MAELSIHNVLLGVNYRSAVSQRADELLCMKRSGRMFAFRLNKKNAQQMLSVFLMESGSDLLSRAVSSQVPSALKGLTSVFGMGTGGSLSPLPPEFS